MDSKLRSTLLESGDEAFISLAREVDLMLDVIHLYILQHPDDTIPMIHRHEDLKEMVTTLAVKLPALANIVRDWKTDAPRVLSRNGVEIEILNEIWITLVALVQYFTQLKFDVSPYDHSKAELAYSNLTRVNRCLQ